MPAKLGRNLRLCFPKIRRPLSHEYLNELAPPTDNSHTFTGGATASTFFKNFNSLYDITLDPTSKSIRHSSDDVSFSDSDDGTAIPDFATALSSQRFFFSSPGRSNSIIESSSEVPPESDTLLDGSIAVKTYSPDPYLDFRRSMQEMVEARELINGRVSLDYLHELLLCYLALNPKSTHKYIVGAFSDLLISLTSAAEGGRESSTDGGDSCESSMPLM